jgi:penicillin-binding protein 1A
MGSYSGGFASSIAVKIVAVFTILVIIAIGVGLGLSLAVTANIKNQENFKELAPALPTRLLDINGTLITEFASDEKRELVSLSDMPRHLIYAILAREDPDFYNHRGFSIKAITRAFVGQLLHKNWGGGSTITQQVAGTLYTDRRERSLKRKVKELWWAFQMERRYTKNEILEIYINYMNMGPGTYGVETASKYFFNHSAREVDLAESAVLAILLSSPSGFNPLSNPNAAKDRQHFVLERMIKFGYADPDEAEASFNKYWENFDWTRPSISAYYSREDKAPWFSEYVRRELNSMIYGTGDLYRDGYIVNTTLDLRHQETAERLMKESLEKANKEVAALNRRSGLQAERTYRSIVNMLTLCFDLTEIRSTSANQGEARAVSRYAKNVNPIVDMTALVFGISELKDATNVGFAHLKENTEQSVVEGALISIENETGYITSIVGGSKYDESNQLIRATQSFVQPGSAFKPLFYSAAIDSRKFTAATLIYDAPMVFYNNDDTPYIPSNYGGLWRGPVLLYNALSLSLNIPALIILEGIGFDAAINRSASLLGITNEADIRRIFPRVYPLGLGVIATSPVQMARAFAIFANQGRVVTPIAIRTIEDRNGRVIYDVAREELQRQQRMGSNIQIITPQNAYVMTRIMERAATGGTLAYGAGAGSKFVYLDENGNSYRIPVAGKTGTTQNWSDAWAVGYSPYYTTAVWFGFDKPGNTLGQAQTGAVLAGPVWGDLMREMHKGLPQKAFARPSTGVVEITVCLKSGLLKNENCNEGETWLPFLAGTQPTDYCNVHKSTSPLGNPINTSPFQIPEYRDSNDLTGGRLSLPTLNYDALPELREQPRNNQRTPAGRNNRTPSPNNPFLDDDFPSGNNPPNTPGDEDDLPGWSPLN